MFCTDWFSLNLYLGLTWSFQGKNRVVCNNIKQIFTGRQKNEVYFGGDFIKEIALEMCVTWIQLFYISWYHRLECRSEMLLDPHERLSCRLQGVSCVRLPAAGLVSPLGGAHRASRRMGFSASSNFFLHAWNCWYWEAVGLQNGVMCLSASLPLQGNFL